MTKTTMALLAAAAMFGTVSAAQAGSKDDPDSGGASGPSGYRIGPLGQPMGGPMTWRGRPYSVYAYVPRARLNQRWYDEDAYGRRVIR
jgi:hypothetical protein